MEEIVLECINCKNKFDAYIEPDGFVTSPGWGNLCSGECFEEFNSDENIRDRKLNKIL